MVLVDLGLKLLCNIPTDLGLLDIDGTAFDDDVLLSCSVRGILVNLEEKDKKEQMLITFLHILLLT